MADSTEDENNRQAFRRIRMDVAVVFLEWDPLSLRGVRGFQSSYDEHVGPVAAMVKRRLPVEEIAAYLDRLVSGQWGFPPMRDRTRKAAEKMRRAGDFIDLLEGNGG